jgi:hypothetical protein
MALAYDTAGTGGSASNASSITYSHTVAASDPALAIYVFAGDRQSQTLTGITYAGVACTSLQNSTATPGGGRILALFSKTAPATGANNVVVTFSGGVYADAQSLSYTGADQTDMVDTSTIASATGNLTISVITTADNCWLSSAGVNTTFGSVIAGTGTTSRSTIGSIQVGDSNGAKTPAGSHSMQWTRASGTTAAVMVAIKPSTGGASGPANLKSLDTNVKANISSYNTNPLANIKSINTNA